MESIYCYDPAVNDPLSKVRGIGRYLQILKENFPKWKYVRNLEIRNSILDIFINPFFNFLQPPLKIKGKFKKKVAVIHDLIPLKHPKHFPVGIKGQFNILRNKLALKNYDIIVTDSYASKKDIVRLLKVKQNKIRIIYPCLPKIFGSNSIIDNRYTEKNNEKPTSNIKYPISGFCLYVGDATWNKNLVNLAKAIKIINATCVFVGKVFQSNSILDTRYSEKSKKPIFQYPVSDIKINHPWQREFKQLLKEVENDKRFIFLGYVPDEKLIQLYRQAKCNILVSRDEGFGFSYFEAASQGCPSVLADINVLRETSKNKGALFAKPDNPNGIANSIGEVYFNQSLRNKLGKDAKERTRFFSQQKIISEFNKIF